MSTLESGPKLDWTRDNQMYERYRIWRKKVEFIFCSALADSTPKQLVSYFKYWMGDQGIPLIEKWESTGKLDYSNSRETPATEGGRRKALSSGYKLQTYWDLLDEEFKPKGNKLLSIIELWTRSNVSSNRIKIQEILLILQLETDYFSKLFISEMLHSKQWYYSLHRDFQNCYST